MYKRLMTAYMTVMLLCVSVFAEEPTMTPTPFPTPNFDYSPVTEALTWGLLDAIMGILRTFIPFIVAFLILLVIVSLIAFGAAMLVKWMRRR